ncbi:MAG: biotin synthase BioB [Candidatus Methanoperedens sp.]|uniref:biotin synthase BioB n=1 Tax=Candidatus Methanoperedens sp. BLZ2 TaxID=2035255 RepID=UPI000BE3CD80|nr:biotin synthase BioB [Candidatus Methanoperedens sp. BLZ2]KAB2946931.1 MAG: biotin synthase BioB [Candidatus Methanoperedens sp.]MBZ0176727.1 biotin synthase BioB [Candidatus Methanoperedens nitroreducens]MCX9080449.1 biotin synthase BioB [Candidatus Methanoperedens sp.]
MLKKIVAKIEKNESIDFTEALELIQLEGKDCMELFSLANHVRSKLGDRVDLCSIVNAKCGLCSEDCKFCAQSVHNDTEITPYPMMEEEEILNMAQMMEEEGSARFCIVTSGKDVGVEDFENMLSSIRRIRKETRLSVCISSGMLTDERALALKSAGATRLHHNLETSKGFFNKICTTHTYDDKIKTIHIAQRAGFEVCCGGIIGMGESIRDRLELAFTLRELDVDSIPINILNPIKGTPLDTEKPIKPLDIMKTISVFRLILPGKNIRIAGGREKNLRDMQGLCLLAGANGLLLGNYLTTQGRTPRDDIMMINDLGLIPGGVHV